MEYICVINGPEQGIHPVNSKKKRNELLNRNIGCHIKSFGRRAEAEIWYTQKTMIKKQDSPEPPKEVQNPPLNKNTIIVLNQNIEHILGYIAVKNKKKGKSAVFSFTSVEERKKILTDHQGGWAWQLFKSQERKKALEWAECVKVNTYEKLKTDDKEQTVNVAIKKPDEIPQAAPKVKEEDKAAPVKKIESKEGLPEKPKYHPALADVTFEDIIRYEEKQKSIFKMAEPGEVKTESIEMGADCRQYLQWYYMEGGNIQSFAIFNAHVHKKENGNIVLTRVLVAFKDKAGDTIYGKEDHVWIPECPAAVSVKLAEGDNISFKAQVYAYKRTDGSVDYSLKNLTEITKVNSYFVPTEQALIKMHADRISLKTNDLSLSCQMEEIKKECLSTIKEYAGQQKSYMEEFKTLYENILKNNPVKIEELKIIRPKMTGFTEEEKIYRLQYKCPECGTYLETGYHFCPGCGRGIDWKGLSTSVKN